MKHAIIGVCLFAAACSGQPLSPSAPSVGGVAGAQRQANGSANVEVTFTKWVPAFPTLAGVTGSDVPGTFAGAVLSRDPFDNGNIVQLEARYEVIGQDSVHSFVAHIEGKQNNETQKAVFNGTIIEGWLRGARVHVTYDVIVPPVGTSCVPQAPVNRTCFQGTIRIMPSSAS
jgi:hypothetical protein